MVIGQVARGARGEGDRRGLGAQLEVPALEVAQRGRVSEENDLAVGLPAELESDGELGERRMADVPAAIVHLAAPMGASDTDGALAHRGEDRVPLGLLEHPGHAGIPLLELRDHLGGRGLALSGGRIDRADAPRGAGAVRMFSPCPAGSNAKPPRARRPQGLRCSPGATSPGRAPVSPRAHRAGSSGRPTHAATCSRRSSP